MRLIIDCSHLCYRSLYTGGELTHQEKQVGVIFGFLRQILKLADQFKTNQLIFCWDSKQSYRKMICPEYKANRRNDLTPEEAEDLKIAYSQFDILRDKVLPYMGFSNIFYQNGYEADDLIALICYRLPDDTMIISSDNDLFQLLRQDRFCPVRMWNFKAINDEAHFSQAWHGLKPIDWVKVKAIAGCDGDNVKGIYGIGPDSAAKYVAGILKGKKLEQIERWKKESKEKWDINFALVTLPFAGLRPINIKWINSDNISVEKFEAIFGQYGFRSLLGEGSAKWKEAFFGGNKDGGKSGTPPVRKIQR